MPTNYSEVDKTLAEHISPQSLGDEEELHSLLVEMVTDQAPRIFAVVIEPGDRENATIAAWGIAFEDSAYMVTSNGTDQYALAAPENSLNYVRHSLHTTPHLIWVNTPTPFNSARER